jgi:hypothetical protein
VPYVSRTLEETSKTHEVKMTMEKVCKIVFTSRFEEEIHIAQSKAKNLKERLWSVVECYVAK